MTWSSFALLDAKETRATIIVGAIPFYQNDLIFFITQMERRHTAAGTSKDAEYADNAKSAGSGKNPVVGTTPDIAATSSTRE